MSLFLLLGSLLALAVPPGGTQGVNFTRESIDSGVGLYYEPMHQIRFAKGEWRFVTYIDMKRFESQKPFLSEPALRSQETICWEYTTRERCASILDTTYLRSKYDIADKYMKHIQSLLEIQPGQDEDADTPTEKRSVPLGIIGSISRALFGILDEEDAAYYNDEIDKLYANQKDMVHLVSNQTHIVQAEFHRIHGEIENMKNRSSTHELLMNKIIIDLGRFKKSEERITFFSNLEQWMRLKEMEIDNYVNNLQTMINAIYFAKLGFIHPGLMTPQILEDSVNHFLRNNDNRERVFPISIAEVRSGDLGKISKTSIGYHNGKLLFVMHVPLLDPSVYYLYKMHPFPTLQIFGDNEQGSAYIQPRTDYLVISQEQAVYTLIHEDDLPHCFETRNYHICAPSYPFYKSTMHPICEISLITDEKHEPFEDCDIRISKTFNPYWKQLNNMKAWLYSLPEEERVQIICGDTSKETITLEGSGILRVKHGCHAHTSYASFMGYQIIEQETAYQYNPSIRLNISDILPEISGYEPLRTPYKQTDIPRVAIDANIPGVLSYDTTLDEVQKKLEFIGEQKREKQKQEKMWYWAILGELALAAGFVGYVLRMPTAWIFWKLISCCIYKQKEDKSDKEIESPSYRKARNGPIYDTPSNQVVF